MAWFAVTVFCMSAVMEVSTLQPGQTPNVLTGCLNVPVDLVFLVDTSGSVGTSGFEQMLGFIQSVSANLNLGMGAAQDRVAVAFFRQVEEGNRLHSRDIVGPNQAEIAGFNI